MKYCKWCFLVLVVLCVGFTYPIQAGQSVIVRVDLENRLDFDRFSELGITPFIRMANVFFVEVEIDRLAEVRRTGVPFEIVDREPFSGHYYLGTVETIVSRKIPVGEMERLTEAGGLAIYKTATPIDRAAYRRYGFDPVEVTRREIPLVYQPMLTAAGAMSSIDVAADIDSLIGLISQDSLLVWDQRLEDFQTRLSLSDSSIAARDWIKAKFESFGYTDVQLQQFWIDDNRYGMAGNTDNILCIKEGAVEPDKVIVIGGHWDSIVYDGNDPYVFAPGADDDGSGTVATLEIARILADVPTRKTIVFVAFGAEENGLNGSWVLASTIYNQGIDLELMLNMDMIGYNPDTDLDVLCNYDHASLPYLNLMMQLAYDYTSLQPLASIAGGGSDHYPFMEYGYNILYAEEGEFNFPGWHTVIDLTANMDFAYMTEVVKMVFATAYAVSSFPSSVRDAVARDVGDGESLYLEWSPSIAPDIAGYWVFWSASPDVYFDSLFVSGGSTGNTTIGGLADGQMYYFSVVAEDFEGNQSFLRPQVYGTPHLIPLAPTGVSAEPGDWRIDLTWAANQEMDFDFYRIYRADVPGVYSLLVDNWDGTSFVDSVVTGGIMYEYVITAVDLDLNESEQSAMVSAAAATFDQGILIVDQTPPDAGNPTTAQKEAFFDAVFAGLPASYYYFDAAVDDLNKSIIGQYNAIFWFEDGNAAASWDPEDLAKVRWYLEHNTHLFLAGWRTAFEFAGQHSHQALAPGNFLYDYAGVNQVDEIYDVDFKGALGQAGWPDGLLDPAKVYSVWNGKMGWIGALGLNPASEAIYLYNSQSGANTGAIVGSRQENVTGKMVFLSVPFYYLYDADAQAIIAGAAEWFDLGSMCDCSGIGDCSDDGEINPVDVVYLINYALRLIGPPPPSDARCPVINRGDYDCDGMVGMLDVVKLINYVYRYPAPGPCDPCPE